MAASAVFCCFGADGRSAPDLAGGVDTERAAVLRDVGQSIDETAGAVPPAGDHLGAGCVDIAPLAAAHDSGFFGVRNIVASGQNQHAKLPHMARAAAGGHCGQPVGKILRCVPAAGNDYLTGQVDEALFATKRKPFSFA